MMDEEFKALMNLKQMEISQAQNSYDQQIGNMGNGMVEERDKLKQQNEKRQDEIMAMHKKVAELETEVDKVKSGLEGVKQQVQDKQNNPKVSELTEFFKAKDDIVLIDAPTNKLKMESFDLERKACDYEFQNDQLELTLRKKHQESL